MSLLGQFQASSIFLYEKRLTVKKHQNAKQTTFTILEVLCTQKVVVFITFYSLIFILLVGLGLIYVFVRSKFLRKKKKTDLKLS